VIFGIGIDLGRDRPHRPGMRAPRGSICAAHSRREELQRYFDRKQRSACSRPLRFLATRFAAKEAISKALGLGMRQPMSWRAVQILNAPSGRPEVFPNAALAEFMRERRLRLQISVTDERGNGGGLRNRRSGRGERLGARPSCHRYRRTGTDGLKIAPACRTR